MNQTIQQYTARFPRFTVSDFVGNGLKFVVLSVLIGATICHAESPTLRTWLKNGSFIDGKLMASTRESHVRIDSKLFSSPIDFDVRGVRSIAGDYSPDEPKTGHAFLLANGTRISGVLQHWSDTHLVVKTPSLGTITLDRSLLRAVESIHDSGKRIYSGPKSIDDWQILDDSGKWDFSAGSLSSPDNEALAGGDVKLPNTFRLSLAMSWKGRADFVMSLGCSKPSKPQPKPEGRARRAMVQPAQDDAAVRLEMWDAQLAVVREVGNLADIAVLPLDDGVAKFELVFYIDQRAGLVAVYSPRGKMLEKIQVAEDKGKANSYALLENHGKSVSLDRFDVYEWDGHLPNSTEYPEGYVLDKDDKVYQSVVSSFDADTQKIVLGDEKKTKLAMSDIRRIILEKPNDKKEFKVEEPAETKSESDEKAKSGKPKVEDEDEDDAESKKDLEDDETAESDADKEDVADAKKEDLPPPPEFQSIPVDEERLIEVEFADTSRLVGYLASAENNQMRFVGDGLLGRFGCSNDQIVSISGAGKGFKPDAPAETQGTLSVEGIAEVAGVLVDNPNPKPGEVLRWRPWASPTDAAIHPHHSGEIMYGRKGVYKVPTAKPSPASPKRQQGGLDALIGGIFGQGQPNQNKPAKKNEDAVPKPRKFPHYEIVFRSGDTVDGGVASVNEEGVTFDSSETSTEFVAHDQMDSITLARMISKPNFDDEELKRLMTVPRNQKTDPPTHLLISTTGDYLRGRLVGVSEEFVGLEIRLAVHDIPRKNVSRIIWLHDRPWLDEKADQADPDDQAGDADEPNAEPAEAEVPALVDNRLAPFLVHVVRPDKRGVTFVPKRIVDGAIIGESDLLGDCAQKIDSVHSVLFGRNVGEKALALRKESWKLSLATLPKVYQDDGESGGAMDNGKSSPMVGKDAPEIKLQTIDDVEFVLSENQDKLIVLDFWASWCGPCIANMPKVEELIAKYDPRKVELVAVNLQDSVQRARIALKRMEIEPTVVMDVDGEAAQFYDARAIPQTVIVDTNGKITHVFVGGGKTFLTQFEAALVELLGEPKAAGE